MSGKKVLIVTYYWYPFGGVGTYRISRFAKYLAKAGWEVVILTTKKAAAGMQEEPDDPVLKNMKVFRSNIIEPVSLLKSSKKKEGITSNPSIFYSKNNSWKNKLAVWLRLNVMVPDAKFTWKLFAVPLGKKIIKQEKPDIILSTSPPPTTSLIAKSLSTWSGLPWVADFRDPWTNIYYYDDNPQSSWAKRWNKKMEASVLEDADKLTLVNHGFFPEHEEHIAEKSTVIPNGFDPDHIVESKKSSDSSFTIRYFGSMKINQRPDAFIDALKSLSRNEPEKANNVILEFYGNIDPQIQSEINRDLPNIETSFNGYIAHHEMMKLVAGSDLLLLTIGKSKNSKMAFSTKIFEYMTSGNPVLGIGPTDGAAAKLIEQTKIGKLFAHNDNINTTKFLSEVIQAKTESRKLFSPNHELIKTYSFKYHTETLEKVMNKLTTSNQK